MRSLFCKYCRSHPEKVHIQERPTRSITIKELQWKIIVYVLGTFLEQCRPQPWALLPDLIMLLSTLLQLEPISLGCQCKREKDNQSDSFICTLIFNFKKFTNFCTHILKQNNNKNTDTHKCSLPFLMFCFPPLFYVWSAKHAKISSIFLSSLHLQWHFPRVFLKWRWKSKTEGIPKKRKEIVSD